MLLHTLVLAADEDANLEMLSKDGRVVYAPVNSKFEYKTILPGEYDRVESGMHSISIINGNCSTRLFDCHIEKNKEHAQLLKVIGTMNYGLKKITLLGKNSIPVVILFYPDHFWPEIDSHTFQYLYELPLVTNAKGTDIVTLKFFILHLSLTNVAEFAIYTSSKNALVYSSSGENNVEQFPHILNIEPQQFAMHAIISITVRKLNPIDYYSVHFNGQYNTRVIVWDKNTNLAKYDIIEDIVSLLPLNEIVGHFINSASHNTLYGSSIIIGE
ncbi:unnamed protein product [Hymenolepis diminuta]|uniref:IgGFc_binding domain-containing protein n=1 Tax=Hymenolepis diminuta TaxID=6216 RepID=A0A0R3S8J2_HYMDI|nr:unnamed protein product [Hymenolepis diminuta]